MGPSPPISNLRLSEIIAPLSYALDLAEGQPQGHALRTTLIGMRLAREIYLLPKQRSTKNVGFRAHSSDPEPEI